MGPLQLLRADIRASIEADGESASLLRVAAKLLLTTRLQAVVLLRLAQWAAQVCPPAAPVLKYLNNVVTEADIAYQAEFGPGLRLFHPSGVVVGPRCVVGANCTLMQGTSLGESGGASPRLGDEVFLGAGAAIFGDIEIGDRCIIGANAVVTRSFEADTMVGGVPAKVIRGPGWTAQNAV